MKLLFTLILFPFLSVGMQDPKNMSRQMLEQAFAQAQKTIGEQQQMIAFQREAFNLVWKLNYGNQLERASAAADLKQLKILEYINKRKRNNDF